MIGRGIFDNPYLFSGTITLSDKTPEEKLQLLLDHMRLWVDTWGNTKHFPVLRKFFKVYANGFPGAQDLRMQLMETQNPEETVAPTDASKLTRVGVTFINGTGLSVVHAFSEKDPDHPIASVQALDAARCR